MAHHSYTRVGGNWTDGVDTLTAADLEDFEQKIFESINGDEGGTWAPSGTVVIGGSGVDLQGANHVLSGTLTVDGDIQLDGILDVGSGLGSITFSGATGRPLLGSRLLYRTSFSPFFQDNTKWVTDAGKLICAVVTNEVGALMLDHLPHGSSLLEVNVRVAGVLSGATMPTTMPTLQIWKRHVTSGTVTQIGTTTTDATANQAAFEAIHLLTVTGFSETIDRANYVYYALLSSPAGGNTAVGFYALPPVSSFGVTQMDDGAA